MNSTPNNPSQRVLQWNCTSAEKFEASRVLPPETTVELVGSRAEFVLRLVQRKHQFAIVATSDPFGETLQQLRQFAHHLQGGPPVVLLLTDCPFPFIGIEKDFFAVIHDDATEFEMRQTFASAARRNEIETSGTTPSQIEKIPGSRTSIQSNLHQAKRCSIISVTGEVGTAKALLARTLHQMRGGTEKDCVTFYCGNDDDSVIGTISDLLSQSAQANTFILRDPSEKQIDEAADLFSSGMNVHGKLANQLIVMNDTCPSVTTGYSLSLIPLRQRSEDIRELTASMLTGMTALLPDLHVSVDPEVIEVLTDHNWPGNIYQFNLTIVGMLLRHAESKGDWDLILDTDALKTHVRELDETAMNSRTQLRNRLTAICDTYVRNGWGNAKQLRNMLNQVLLQNMVLAWQADASSELEALRQTEESLRRAA